MTELPRLVALDLDGTFLSPDSTVSDINMRAIETLARASVPVVFATGRPVRCLDVLDGVATDTTVTVATNGAVLFDHGSKRAVKSHPLDHATVRRIVSACRRELPAAAFAVELPGRFGYEPAYADWPATDKDPAAVCADLDQILQQGDVLKVLVRCPGQGTHATYLQTHALIGDLASISYSAIDDRGPVEFCARGVSKATTLHHYCLARGIPRERVWAFGDMPNDLPLLQWAGKACIVANAHPSMRRYGFTQVASNRDSGVGRALLSWLENRADG